MGSPAAGGVPVRRAKFVTEVMTPPCEPVPMLVRLAEVTHAWLPSLGHLRPLPDRDQGPATAFDAIAGRGRVVLFERATLSRDESLLPGHRLLCTGVWRLDLVTGAETRAIYDPVQVRDARVEFAGSPDGERVAIAQSWSTLPGTRPEDHRVTLWLAGFDERGPQELLTWTGITFADADDAALQFSPDGTWLAVTASPWIGPPTGYGHAVLVFDVGTGRHVRRLLGHTLVGTLSWSPDGTRLLVAEFSTQQVSVHDLRTGQTTPVPTLPGRRPDSWTAGPRPLGFADHRLLTLTARRTSVAIAATDPTTGQHQTLLRWTGQDMYPALARTTDTGHWP